MNPSVDNGLCSASHKHVEYFSKIKDVLTETVQLDDTSSKRLEDVFKTYLWDVLKASWRRMDKTNILVLTKTSWRRLEDVFWRRMINKNIFVFIKTLLKMKTKDVFKASSTSRRMFAGTYLVSEKLLFSIKSFLMLLMSAIFFQKSAFFWPK